MCSKKRKENMLCVQWKLQSYKQKCVCVKWKQASNIVEQVEENREKFILWAYLLKTSGCIFFFLIVIESALQIAVRQWNRQMHNVVIPEWECFVFDIKH